MPRRSARPQADRTLELPAHVRACPSCSHPLWAANKAQRTVTTLKGLVRPRLQVRSCRDPECPRRGACLRPEQEGRFALPQHEFGLDVIATVGRLRHAEHRGAPEIHAELARRGVAICMRSVGNLLDRYDELLALSLTDVRRIRRLTEPAGRVILAIDGLQPDVGHEVLWVIRDVLSGEVLLAKSLLSSCRDDLAELLCEVKSALPVYEADRHAKVQLEKKVRGIRPIEREVEARQDAGAELVRGYRAAVRSALTDDGRPPLGASGLKPRDRLAKVADSLDRVGAKRGCRRN